MSRSEERLLAALRSPGRRVFTSADLGALAGLDPVPLARALSRAARRGFVARLRRGVWTSRLGEPAHPYEAVPYLRAPWPAYVSLFSALSEHGLIEEVPPRTYAVTAGPPKRFATPLGEFAFHHLPARLVWGYATRRSASGAYPLAEPEKSLLDTAYLAGVPRSPIGYPYRRERTWKVDRARLARYARRFASERLDAWLRKERLL